MALPLSEQLLTLSRVDDITHVIQLAVAPVFLLTAVGTLLAVLTNRLGRAVDRARVLEKLFPDILVEARAAERAAVETELQIIDRRVKLIYAAIVLAVLCALCICILIAVAFTDAFLAISLSNLLGVLFIGAMLALIGSLLVFMREIFVAVTTVRHVSR
jgi:hypothetical protein